MMSEMSHQPSQQYPPIETKVVPHIKPLDIILQKKKSEMIIQDQEPPINNPTYPKMNHIQNM